jgi:hypothetical protein
MASTATQARQHQRAAQPVCGNAHKEIRSGVATASRTTAIIRIT